MVIVDTSVWIPFFNRPGSTEQAAVAELIDADEVALVGVVLAELLQGCRSDKESQEVREALLGLVYLEVNQSIWIKAGELSAALLRKGVTLPQSDVVVAALAFEHSCSVYSLDEHFRKISGLRRYAPPA